MGLMDLLVPQVRQVRQESQVLRVHQETVLILLEVPILHQNQQSTDGDRVEAPERASISPHEKRQD